MRHRQTGAGECARYDWNITGQIFIKLILNVIRGGLKTPPLPAHFRRKADISGKSRYSVGDDTNGIEITITIVYRYIARPDEEVIGAREADI